MSNLHLLPNLAGQQQQRLLQKQVQHAQACMAGVPGTDPFFQAEQQLQELIECIGQLNNCLAMVGHVQPMFDINYLTREGKTAVASLDQHYMLTVGTSLVSDYHTFRDSSATINQRVKILVDKFNIARQSRTQDALADVLAEATFIHGEYVQWTESFLLTIAASIRDIINHLNLFRSPENQIVQPFPENLEGMSV